jgi:hypothetical protein
MMPEITAIFISRTIIKYFTISISFKLIVRTGTAPACNFGFPLSLF